MARNSEVSKSSFHYSWTFVTRNCWESKPSYPWAWTFIEKTWFVWHKREGMKYASSNLPTISGFPSMTFSKYEILCLSRYSFGKCLNLWGNNCWVRREKKNHTFYPQNFEKNDKKLIKFKKKEDSVAANLKFTKHDFIIYDLVLLEPVESSSKHAVEFGNALHWLDLLW